MDSESADAVVIRGAIDLVDAGSGATRALVGLGAGQSKLTCRSWILQPGSTEPAVTLTVVGGSHGRGGLFGSGYLTIGDARDAGEQIAQFLLKARAQ